jgi:hypothetical protein
MSDEEWMRSPLRRLTPRARGQVESDEQRLIRETMHDVIRFSKRARTADAVEANRARGACQAARALLLSDQGLSAPVIGIRMALERTVGLSTSRTASVRSGSGLQQRRRGDPTS